MKEETIDLPTYVFKQMIESILLAETVVSKNQIIHAEAFDDENERLLYELRETLKTLHLDSLKERMTKEDCYAQDNDQSLREEASRKDFIEAYEREEDRQANYKTSGIHDNW